MLISISIDISGSTKAKHLFTSTGQLDAYFKSTIIVERDLYYDFKAAPDLFKRLRLVKTIGDEWWYVVDIEPAEPLAKLIEILHNVTSKTFYITNSDDNPIPLGLKCFMDVLSDTVDIASFRHAEMFPVVRSVRELNFKTTLTAAELEDLSSFSDRLNTGNILQESDGTVQLITPRLDLVGASVDHFFRATKSSRAGLLTIGSNFLKALNIPPADFLTFVYDGTRTLRIPVIPESIPDAEMKGIDREYIVYHSPPPTHLQMLEPTSLHYDLFAPTRALLEGAGFINGNGRVPSKWPAG